MIFDLTFIFSPYIRVIFSLKPSPPQKKKRMTWIYPPPSNSGKWRFIGIPY